MSGSPDNAIGRDVVIARIVKPHGIRGEVACEIETDFLERFAVHSRARIRKRDGAVLDLEIENSRFVKNRVLLKFKGCDTMDAAHGLVGGSLVIDESDRMTLDPDEFYEYDLLGLQAITRDGRSVGTVVKLIPTGAAPVLVVDGGDGQEILIPFTASICGEVDVSLGRITVDAPEGLLELNVKSKRD